MSDAAEVRATGCVTPALAAVVPALERLAADRPDGALAITVVHEGRCVLDVAIGCEARDRFLLFSVTKLLTASVLWQASERGDLDLDEPLATTWPELARPATERITPRMVLQHRSGLAGIERTLSLSDLEADGDDAAIGMQEPYWEPGSRHGYHAFTYGTLLRGLVRRSLDTSVRDLVDRGIAAPLGVDLAIGVHGDAAPRAVRAAPLRARLARLESPAGVPQSTTSDLQEVDPDVLQDSRFLALELPGTNGVATSLGIARTLDALGSGRLGVSAGATSAMTSERSRGLDATLGFVTAFGTGVQLPFPMLPMLGAGSWGHEAAGGSIAVHDPARALSIAILTDAAPPVGGASASAIAAMAALDGALRGAWSELDDDPTPLGACT